MLACSLNPSVVPAVVDVLRQLAGDRLGSLESSEIGRFFKGFQSKSLNMVSYRLFNWA